MPEEYSVQNLLADVDNALLSTLHVEFSVINDFVKAINMNVQFVTSSQYWQA